MKWERGGKAVKIWESAKGVDRYRNGGLPDCLFLSEFNHLGPFRYWNVVSERPHF